MIWWSIKLKTYRKPSLYCSSNSSKHIIVQFYKQQLSLTRVHARINLSHWSIKEPYICQAILNIHSLHGKVSVNRTWGGGLVELWRNHWDIYFSKQSKQSEDFLNQGLKSVQWTTSLTEKCSPILAAGRANNLWDLVWRATPLNPAWTKHTGQYFTCIPYPNNWDCLV